jgi:Tfp pilus assembly protein PilO
MSMAPGNSPLSHLRSQVDSKLAELESRRATYSESEAPSWPSGAKLFRVVLLVVVVIVLIGWVLTALNR